MGIGYQQYLWKEVPYELVVAESSNRYLETRRSLGETYLI